MAGGDVWELSICRLPPKEGEIIFAYQLVMYSKVCPEDCGKVCLVFLH